MQAVIFDFGGVVAHFRPQQRLEAFAAATGLTPAAAHDALYLTGWVAANDLGEYTPSESYESALRHLGVSLPYESFRTLWSSAFGANHEVLSLVRDLRRSGLKTGLLTDNGPILRDALPALIPGIATIFDTIVFSCDVGVTKPDSRTFQRVLADLNVEPSQTLFVDDSLVNVEAARDLRILSHHFIDAQQLRIELARIGINGSN